MTKAKQTPSQTQSFMDEANAISDNRRKTQMKKLDKGFDDRAAFEATHAPANNSIQTKLTTYRNKMVLPGIAALTLAAHVDPNFMNGSGVNANKRFNVYAIDKLADLLHGLNNGHIKNAVNKCIVQSLFRFQAAEVPFTGVAAQGAVRINPPKKEESEFTPQGKTPDSGFPRRLSVQLPVEVNRKKVS